jgi:hypothetical protein
LGAERAEEEEEDDTPLAALHAQKRRKQNREVVAGSGGGEEGEGGADGGSLGGYVVYLLRSTSTKRSYVGMTNDLPRRLRQHNGETDTQTHPYADIAYVVSMDEEIDTCLDN